MYWRRKLCGRFGHNHVWAPDNAWGLRAELARTRFDRIADEIRFSLNI